MNARKTFSLPFYLIVVPILLLGLFFAWLLKQGLIDKYYSQRIPLHVSRLVFYKPTPYKIGFFTDAHLKRDATGKDFPQETKLPFQSFINQMQAFKPDLIIDGGDFIEGSRRRGALSVEDYQLGSSYLQQIDTPYYHVLGNHDVRGITKPEWLEMVGYDKSYYTIDLKGLRIFVLDSNYKPTDEGDIDIAPKRENYFTRGYISQRQLAWLDMMLKNTNHKRKIVFVHHPHLEETTFQHDNVRFPKGIEELWTILNRYKINAVFSGHIEEAYYEKRNQTDYFVLPGFYKSEKYGEDEEDEEENIDQEKESPNEQPPVKKGSFAEIEITDTVKVTLFYQPENTDEYTTMILSAK